MATDTQTPKMTKADLKDALVVAEFNLGICDATIDELRHSVEERDLRIIQLQEENATRASHAAQLEDTLRSTGAQVAQIDSDIQIEREAAALIEESLASDVANLFGHLHFAVSTLAAIAAYGGDNADVLRNLALTSGGELIDLVEAGVESGRYSVEGALLRAINIAYEAIGEQAEDETIKYVPGPEDF